MKTYDIFKIICKDIIANEDKLTELDQKIGDGDHGTNMTLGFSKIAKEIGKIEKESHSIIEFVGKTLMATVGGASGPLYGIAFIKGANALEKGDVITLSEFKKFVTNALESIINLGGAHLGDKTMVDVWSPLKTYLDKVDRPSKDELLKVIIEARDYTYGLQAKKGRASYLGKRSIGTIDPGSYSSAIILTQMVKGLSE